MMVDHHDAGNLGQNYGEGIGSFLGRTIDVSDKHSAGDSATAELSENLR